MFVRQFSWTLIEVAFNFFLFDFGNIDPFTAIFAYLWFPKNIILQYLFMLIFSHYRIKGIIFLQSSFLQVMYQFFIRVANSDNVWDIGRDVKNFFAIFGVRVRRWESIDEFEDILIVVDSSGSRIVA